MESIVSEMRQCIELTHQIGIFYLVDVTFTDCPAESKVTSRFPGVQPMYPVMESKLHMLELVLCELPPFENMCASQYIREAVLASDDFLLKFSSHFIGIEERHARLHNGENTCKLCCNHNARITLRWPS